MTAPIIAATIARTLAVAVATMNRVLSEPA
jgi:hypothetical protein